jgi:hypothetical protein
MRKCMQPICIVKTSVLMFVSLFFLLQPTYAGVLKPDQASSEVLSRKTTIKINKDLSVMQYIEAEILLKNESSKSAYSIYEIEFNPASEVLSDVYTAVKTKDGIFLPDPKNIEDAQENGTASGFDKTIVRRIPLPKVEVGAIVIIKYRILTKRPPIPSVVHWRITLQQSATYYKKFQAEISSEVPLHFWKRDYDNIFEVVQKGDKNWSVKINRPYIGGLINEIDPYGKKATPNAFGVSNVPNWEQMVAKYLVDLAERVPVEKNAELDALVTKISKIKDENERIRAVMKYVVTTVNYVGDWRSVDGAFFPRPLSTIMKVKYGDCKDYSLVVSYLLNRLGIKTHLALVNRSAVPPWSGDKAAEQIPLLKFNHMIAVAETKTGLRFLDATNQVVFDARPRNDIAGRPVLVLNSEFKSPIYSPEPAPENDSIKIHYDVHYINDDTFRVQAMAEYFGLASQRTMEKFFGQNGTTAANKLAANIAGSYDWLSIQGFAPLLPTAIVPDYRVTMKGEMILPQSIYRTTLGDGILDSRYLAGVSLLDRNGFSESRVSDQWLDFPNSFERTIRIHNFKVKGDLPLGCDLKNEFFSVKQTFRKIDSTTLERRDQTQSFKSVIPLSLLTKKSFRQELETMQRCLNHTVLIHDQSP